MPSRNPAGINYAPMFAYAVAISKGRNIYAEIGDELVVYGELPNAAHGFRGCHGDFLCDVTWCYAPSAPPGPLLPSRLDFTRIGFFDHTGTALLRLKRR